VLRGKNAQCLTVEANVATCVPFLVPWYFMLFLTLEEKSKHFAVGARDFLSTCWGSERKMYSY
jgi:hypothetical protein